MAPYPGRGLGRWKDSFNFWLSHLLQCIEREFRMLTQRSESFGERFNFSDCGLQLRPIFLQPRRIAMNGTINIGRINFPAASCEGSVLRTDGSVENTLRGIAIGIFILNYLF